MFNFSLSSFTHSVSNTWNSVKSLFTFNPDPLWVKALSEPGYIQFKNSLANNAIETLARQQLVSPYQVMTLAGFAQVRATLDQQLKTDSSRALNYFYNDIINHLVELSAEQIKIKEFKNLLEFYKSYIDEETYRLISQQIDPLTEKDLQRDILQITKKINKVFRDISAAQTEIENTSHEIEIENKHVSSFSFKQFITALATLSLLGSRSGISMGFLFSQMSSVQAIYPVIDLTKWNESNGFIILNDYPNGMKGEIVTQIADFNSDGNPDLYIGDFYANISNLTNAGRGFVVFLNETMPPIFNLSQLIGTNGFTIPGIEAGAYTGRAANSIANMTGDGKNYLIFSAIGATVSGRQDVGQTFLIPNCSSSCPSFLDLNQVNNTQGNFIIKGQSAYANYFGYKIAVSPIKILYISAHNSIYRIDIKNFLNFTIIDLSSVATYSFAVFRSSIIDEYMGTFIGFLNSNNSTTEAAIFGGSYASSFNRLQNGVLKIVPNYNSFMSGLINLTASNINITNIVGPNGTSLAFNFGHDFKTISIDFDNDNKIDFITCASAFSSPNKDQNGACYGFRGSSRPWSSTIDLQYFNSTLFGFVIYGKNNGDNLGLASNLGNIAGTGNNNFILCAGAVPECYLFLIGNSTINWPDIIDLSNTTNSFWITVTLPDIPYSVTNLDDINRDGLDEIAFAINNKILIVYGQRAWGLKPTPTPTFTSPSTPGLTPTPTPTPTITPNSIPTVWSSASSASSSSQTTSISSSQSTTTSTPTQAPTPSIPVIDVIVFTVNPDPIQIYATEGYQLTTSDLYIANLNGIDPNDIQFSLVGDHSNYIITVNDTQTDLFTYAELQGGYVQLFIDGTCYSGPMNVDLESRTPDTTAPSSVSLVFDVTQSLCDQAATHSVNMLFTVAVILKTVGMFGGANKQKIKNPINNFEEVQSERLALN